METMNLSLDKALYVMKNGLTIARDRLHPDPIIMKDDKVYSLTAKSEIQALPTSSDYYLYHDLYTFANIMPELSAGKAVRRLIWPAYMYIFVDNNLLMYGEYGQGYTKQAQLSWDDLNASDWHTYDTLED